MIFVLFLTAIMAEDTSLREPNPTHQQRGRESPKKLTDVLSFAFCDSNLPPEDKMGKNSLEEVHTYASLKLDPRASLPDSFTVCSDVMVTGCLNAEWPVFFNIFDNNRNQFLVP